MARLATLAALLVALLFVANAAAFRTTITTMEIDEDIDNPRRRGESCREQIQRQQYLNRCQDYLRQQCRSGGYDEDNQRQHFRQCCQQLSQMEEQCQCEGLRQAVRQQQQEEGIRGEEMEEMVQCASDLPKECGISSRSCEIRRGRF
ncbi:hypothetical protein I3843_12G125700 [Carya illinoinensis]|uniref:Bifunctional inhibitor/plant lipid transfer protein/seed storage helical domain-containing protein n=1 Tax=Carya illinoinensis TaxID=32201 RepID=A0A8T1NR24_CARIL|nr:2S albumin seed storage protein [Carya illinoinensis]KAG6634556.1 hypothetical protein CIPAW_12G126700 [Carya illinoinensis]KAG6685708.1 hypothetical protein I3842_12G125500 [Carya illinoinensis]KAG7953757.1 hypothetical protein I3843_12G125700 [Carya illinoinensis]